MNRKLFKNIFSIFLGIISSAIFASFFPLFDLEHFELDWVSIGIIFLLFLPYLSFILFLILWNTKKSKLVYLLLIVPAGYLITIAVLIGMAKYDDYIYSIPRMDEGYFYDDLYIYEPFNEYRNFLARLDDVSNLKITENLPVLDGATAFYPIYASFAQTVYPRGKYSPRDSSYSAVLCSRTPNAYNNLLERKADIIFCLEPSAAQMEQFIEKGLNVKFIPIGREAFVFFVNKKNPVNNLTIEEIQGIYSGKIKNWRKVSGKNQSIRAYQRPENSGSQTILEKIMGDIPIIKPKRETIKKAMVQIINEVAAYTNFNNAIGYSFLYYSTTMIKNNEIKILSINNIFPSRETIQDASYPFTQNIYAIYIDDDKKNKNTEPFIKWILSKQGQELISKTGYMPINE
jgi:phosphate transport system substrate-binding protein